MNCKYIFVVGGVMSGVGKGVASASIGKILQSKGYKVTAVKIDPYVNVDAGTMNPTEHGEVFVLDDGTECDQDMGNYERFLNVNLSGANYMTTGSIYLSVINKERSLDYKGRCVEVVPHIPLEVIDKINKAAKKEKAEIIIIEIGGTVGEYQNILFLEAVRMLKLKTQGDVVLVLVSYLPQQGACGELKTKPTQYAVRTLNSAGLQPDMVLARAAIPLDKKRKEKIAFNCNIKEGDVISAPDIKSIYEIPLNFEKDELGAKILKKLGLKPKGRNLSDWQKFVNVIRNANESACPVEFAPRPFNGVKIGIVGKYFSAGDFILADSYISVIEALKHAAFYFKRKPEITWFNAEEFEHPNPAPVPPLAGRCGASRARAYLKKLKECDGIIVPGGFGARGTEGKINAIKFCRENKIPFLGLCYGMQLAIIEYSRSMLGLKKANTTEVDQKTPFPIIALLPEQKKNLAEKDYGATMRLGAYPAAIKANSIAHSAYSDSNFVVNDKKIKNDLRLAPHRACSGAGLALGDLLVFERHRHRFEVNPDYIEKLEKKGVIFSGVSPDGWLMEIMELPQKVHPFFVASQFHPEFKSRPLVPHPLFREFIKAAIKRRLKA